MNFYEQINGDTCDDGCYRITTDNGSIYQVVVHQDRATTMQRLVHAAPTDPERGHPVLALYSDGDPIPVDAWRVSLGNAGAVFFFYAEDARQCERVEDYRGTVRRTSAVVSIERVESDAS